MRGVPKRGLWLLVGRYRVGAESEHLYVQELDTGKLVYRNVAPRLLSSVLSTDQSLFTSSAICLLTRFEVPLVVLSRDLTQVLYYVYCDVSPGLYSEILLNQYQAQVTDLMLTLQKNLLATALNSIAKALAIYGTRLTRLLPVIRAYRAQVECSELSEVPELDQEFLSTFLEYVARELDLEPNYVSDLHQKLRTIACGEVLAEVVKVGLQPDIGLRTEPLALLDVLKPLTYIPTLKTVLDVYVVSGEVPNLRNVVKKLYENIYCTRYRCSDQVSNYVWFLKQYLRKLREWFKELTSEVPTLELYPVLEKP